MRNVIEVLWSPELIIQFQHLVGSGWDWLCKGISMLGDVQAIVVVFALTLWLSGRRLAYGLLGMVLLATVTDLLLWNLVGVPRPHDPRIVRHIKQPVVSSFPSGHTVTATTLWGTLAAWGRLPIAIPILIVLAIMPSRLYLGVHYLGDLLGGGLIGIVLVIIYQRLWSRLERWFSHRPFKFFFTLGLLISLGALIAALVSPRGWEIFGVALGVGIGMPLEYCYVHYSPAKVSLGRQVLKVSLGLGGLATLVLIPYLLGASKLLVLKVVVFTCAALWITCVAPLLFTRLGLSQI